MSKGNIHGWIAWCVVGYSQLHNILCQNSPYEARYGDVVELVRYVYENTPCCKKMDGLRKLVAQYVGTEAKQTACSERCLQLVEDGGPFASDLLSMVPERMR